MSITLTCPQCKKKYVLKDDSRAGKKFVCRVCNVALQSEQKGVSNAARPVSRTAVSSDDTPDDAKEALKNKRDVVSGKYIIINKLGQGGMGTVYKAWDTSLKRYVAIKMLLPSIDEPLREEAIKRLILEAQTSAKLSHPHVLQVYEAGEHNGNYYISMEFVDGGTLEEYWRARHQVSIIDGDNETIIYEKPSRQAVLEYLIILKQVIEGVAYAHSQNIIHRDIKPENVLLQINNDGRIVARVSDFGLAKNTASNVRLTVTGAIVGTPMYMSPEQASGEKMSGLSDIFSIGAMLYKLCAGTEPFSGDGVLEVLKAITNNDPVPPGRLNNAVDKDLETIILKAMAKEPSKRYADARELSGDIERYLKGESILARPLSLTYRAGKKIRKNKLAFAGMSVGFIMLIAVAATLWKASAERRAAEERKQKETAAINEVQLVWMGASESFIEFYKNSGDTDKVWESVNEAIEKLTVSINNCPTANGYFYRGFLYKEKSDLDLAEKDLTEAININPDMAMAHILRGIVYFKKMLELENLRPSITWEDQGKIMDNLIMLARKDFEKISERPEGAGTPADIPGQFKKYKKVFEAISCWKRDKDAKKSLKLLQEGYEEFKSEDFLYWLGVVEESDEAGREYFNRALKIRPQYPEVYFALAVMERKRGNNDNAVQNYTKAIEINPYYYRAYISRGDIKFYLKDYDGAIKDFTAAVGLNRSYPYGYYYRGLSRYMKKDYDNAIEDFSAIIKILPNYMNSYNNRGNVKFAKGDLDGALGDFMISLKSFPDDPNVHFNIGLIKMKKKDFAGAIEHFSATVKKSPDDARAFFERGNALASMKDFARAMEDYNESIKLMPASSQFYTARAKTLADCNDFDGAIKDYNIAVKLSPLALDNYTGRAEAKYLSGDYAAAIDDYSTFLILFPENAEIYCNRGNAFLKMGMYEQALSDYQKAVKLDPALETGLVRLIKDLQDRLR